ncbi:uncharacterized protein MYCFIDRAFT_78061 [Pseudocercospora fijiensis CIRAD86]|uniref:INO80 complex subunit B-like conserved region domain-containing protein n=1 Tax=Pseudocercospora fijiensis (strain CIRAD86) TaxID=383855 RepID=M2ZMJ9_PSEFD|nr:uncharacterized protein MYCFIDRAFT_78061 [Pseudocercospora fijiensis CIRAD86]EME80309.1 hypothetical protein MYCFIDRAFT_78061 [Pseudocercospora fijiensis CIRAD86]
MPPERRSARSVSKTSAKVTVQPYTSANTTSSPGTSRPGASISRPANGKTSLRLTVKAPPSKLRQATSGSAIPPNPYADTPSESDATPAPRAARKTRNPRTVVDPDSDDLDDDMEEDADGEDDEHAEGELDNDTRDNEDSEDDADGEADDDEDDMQVDHPPPPVITQKRAPGKTKPNVTVTAPPGGPLKSVEDKEMDDDDDDDDDEELSELDSNEDAEGEEEEEEEEEEGEEDDSDDDDENSRSATPDLSKLTKRQRGGLDDFGGELMSLSNEAQKKKQLTEEENAMRRAEMARRRKNLSEKRNEEEKMDTINKLLSKPAPKRRTRAEMEAARAAEETPDPEGHDPNGPDPTSLRWVNRRQGSYVVVTQQWLESPFGETFAKQVNHNRLIEEVS